MAVGVAERLHHPSRRTVASPAARRGTAVRRTAVSDRRSRRVPISRGHLGSRRRRPGSCGPAVWRDRAESRICHRSADLGRDPTVATDMLRYVEPATAVVAATRRMRNSRGVLAAFSDAVQRRHHDYDALLRAHIEGRRATRVRRRRPGSPSAPAFAPHPRTTFKVRRGEPASALPADYNAWLRLPYGRVVCVDALSGRRR